MSYIPDGYKPRRPLRERLLAKTKVNPDSGCWEWQAKLDRWGYGMIKLGSDVWKTAHRSSYAEFVGDPGDLLVLHKCNNRRCINPSHLYPGTAKDNYRDAVAAGTLPAKCPKRPNRMLELATRLGISESSLRGRLDSGWPIERALNTPAIRRRERDDKGRYRHAQEF